MLGPWKKGSEQKRKGQTCKDILHLSLKYNTRLGLVCRGNPPIVWSSKNTSLGVEAYAEYLQLILHKIRISKFTTQNTTHYTDFHAGFYTERYT